MFMGVSSHHDARRVTSYEAACAALERAAKTPSGKQRTKKTYGFHLGANRNHGVTWVRKDIDDSIVFRLYDTDVVTWHPSEAVSIENFGTVTTRGFAHRFLPHGFHLHYPVQRRMAPSSGHKGIGYLGADGYRICFGYSDCATFHPLDDDRWEVDPSTCETITMPGRIDAKGMRALVREHHLADYEAWLSMAPNVMDLVHDGWDLDICQEALKARDFRQATMHLPLVDEESFGRVVTPLRIKVWGDNRCVSMGSLHKLRMAMAADANLIEPITATSFLRKDYERLSRRLRELERLDTVPNGMGIG